MPVARCPRCESPVTIDDADLGHHVECPTCRAVFATDEVLGPPTVRRVARPLHDEPEDLIAEARQKVFVPGLLVAGVSVVGIGLEVMVLAIIVLIGPQQFQQQMANMPLLNAGPAPPIEALIGGRFVAIAWESTILAGAFCMMRGKAYGFARAAMTMRLIPCVGAYCLLGFPFGIWALVVLNQPRVREGFELAAGARSRSWDQR